MHSIFAALFARSPARALLATLILGVVVGLLPGCTNHQETPHTLFARIQQLNAAGNPRAIWDLYTDDERARQSGAWDSYKLFLQRNPGEDNRAACRRNFGMEPEALYGLSNIEIFEVLSKGHENAMVDARITDDEPAPDLDNGHRIYWETAAGEKCVMLCQFVDGAWHLVTLRE